MLKLLPVLSALILSLGFLHYDMGWFVLLGFLPLLLFLDKSIKPKHSWNKIAVPIWLAGLLFTLINLVWFLQTKPATWTGINHIQAQGLAIVFWIIIAAVTSLGWLLFGWLASLVIKKYQLLSWQVLFLLPMAWTLSEFARSWLFTVVSWGAGGTWGAHWNLGSLGFAVSATPLVYLSRWVGLFGLSAVAMVFSLGLFWLFKRNYLQAFGLMAALVLGSWLASFVGISTGGQPLKVGAIQLSDQATKDIATLINDSSRADLDLLLMPEYSYPDQLFYGQRQLVIDELMNGPDSLFIYAKAKPATNINEVVYEKAGGERIASHDKTLLVPGGEYFFGWASSLLRVSGNQRTLEAYNQLRQLSKGTEKERAVYYNGVIYGSLACSGVSSPFIYKNLSRQGAQVLTNSASLGVFEHSSYFHQQSKQMLRFHAVANAKPFIQAVRKGYAYIIQPNGQMAASSERIDDSLLVGQVAPNKSHTLFSRFGELWLNFSLLGAGFMLAVALGKRFQRPQKAGKRKQSANKS